MIWNDWLKKYWRNSRTLFPYRIYLVIEISILVLLSPVFISAQTTTEDSVTLELEKQANKNRIAVGLDTIPALPATTNDTIKTKPARHYNSNRKFYWNVSKYPMSDSSLAAKKLRRHSPLYAALFSAALPGLGQAYNKKYWKIPIVYAGLGGLGYACYYTASNFVGYRNAYRAQVALVPDHTASYKGVSDPNTLKEYRDYHKRNLDISAICTSVWYILNIVDAAVDGHLFEWNMKDDIQLSWQPIMISNSSVQAAAPGIGVNLNF